MYTPEHFQETALVTLHAYIKAHPLGALVTHGSDGLSANHLPFLLDANEGEQGVLRAHVSRNNRVWEDAVAGADEALVLFSGESAYITPTWYPIKAETHRVVPTYNYTAVHAHGRIVVHDHAKWLRAHVGRLTHDFETGQEQPWRMRDAPADFLTAMIENIIGIEIVITQLEGKWKMSQNRSEADRDGVIVGLEQTGNPQARAVAREVAERLP